MRSPANFCTQCISQFIPLGVKFLTYCCQGSENRIPECKIRFHGQEVTIHYTFDVSFDELTFTS